MKALTLLLSLLPVALADKDAADSCLRAKIWEGYNDGWAVRTVAGGTLGEGEHRIYLVTLYAGNEYKILACGDNNAKNLDVVLYDRLGNPIQKDRTPDREPFFLYKPTATDTFYVAVFASQLQDAGKKAGVSTAVTYR